MSQCNCSRHNRPFYIKSPKSKTVGVLDASENEVKLQYFTGFPAQLWTWEFIDGKKFTLINKGNGKLLDIKDGAIKKIITERKHASLSQQWIFNPDSTIASASGTGNLVVDVKGENLEAGDSVIASPKDGTDNQVFNFQYV